MNIGRGHVSILFVRSFNFHETRAETSSINRPLKSDYIAGAAIYMLSQPPNISVKALNMVPFGRLPFSPDQLKLIPNSTEVA